MSLYKFVAVLSCVQLLAQGASAQAAAFAGAGDVSALAAAGGGSALAAAGDTSAGYNTVYVQPIVTAFTSSKAYDAAQAVAQALNNNQAASILQAFTQVSTAVHRGRRQMLYLGLLRYLGLTKAPCLWCCRPRVLVYSLWLCATATTTHKRSVRHVVRPLQRLLQAHTAADHATSNQATSTQALAQ